jgi:spore germination cell wall hydrolase CwlJ-like protein
MSARRNESAAALVESPLLLALIVALVLTVILCGFSAFIGATIGGRVSAAKAAAEEISASVLDEPEEAEPAVSRYAGIEITSADIDTLARLVYHEARGETIKGQIAVVEVVLNRCLSEAFPDTVEEVVFQKRGDVWQFSPAPYLSTAEPSETQYEAVYEALSETEYILTEETVFFSTEPYNDHVSAIIGNHYFCEIGG